LAIKRSRVPATKWTTIKTQDVVTEAEEFTAELGAAKPYKFEFEEAP
jgi:hypothetical protein